MFKSNYIFCSGLIYNKSDCNVEINYDIFIRKVIHKAGICIFTAEQNKRTLFITSLIFKTIASRNETIVVHTDMY